MQRNLSSSDSWASSGSLAVSFVHHANQFLITNGYDNREGLDDLVGSRSSENGYLKVLELHYAYRIPINLNVSGTLLESIAWYRPDFLEVVRGLREEGLLELLGSAYGQNIMRFFSDEYNSRQLIEMLDLYSMHFGVDPSEIRVFWSPERVWETQKLAPVLTDTSLPNGGYRAVLLDDRLRYPVEDGPLLRRQFDEKSDRGPADFRSYRIRDGQGLLALPISRYLRESIPPRDPSCFAQIEEQFAQAFAEDPEAGGDRIAIYADDMEKAAGVASWGPEGLAHYEELLKWLNEHDSISVVKLSDWMDRAQSVEERPVDVGSFVEMSQQFGAGDGLDNWYFGPRWRAYREQHTAAECRVGELAQNGADPDLIELAWKQLLVSGWETAWHTPAFGVHGDPTASGEPSPWARAVASHCRLAPVIAEAAHWMTHRDGRAHAELRDIDADGDEELVIKNDSLFAVFSPRWGGRLVHLFSLVGDGGKLVIGNPADDWNWMEELNKYMEIPANHPGALTHLGQVHDQHEVRIIRSEGARVEVEFIDIEDGSPGCGTRRSLALGSGDCEIEAEYEFSETGELPSIECGMSPDYLNLLRRGHNGLALHEEPSALGYSNGEVAVWVRLESGCASVLASAAHREFGHGKAFRFVAPSGGFRLWIGCGPLAHSPLGRSAPAEGS